MSRTSKSKEDYMAFARRKNLLFLNAEPPATINEKCKWQCNNCKEIIETSYRNLKRTKGCSCRSKQALVINDYYSLASSLGLTWVGENIPHNSRTPTQWRTPTGETFSAPYRQLSGRIPSRYHQYLSLVEESN